MGRVLTGLSVAALVLVAGALEGCQRHKPCRCVETGACHCPLPAPPKTPPPPTAPATPKTTEKAAHHASHHHARHHERRAQARATGHHHERVAEREHRERHHYGRAHEHRWEREATLSHHHADKAYREAERTERTRRSERAERESEWTHRRSRHRRTEFQPESPSGGALNYDYQSSSHSYWNGEQSSPEDRRPVQEPRSDRDGREDFESWERHHRLQHRSWRDWQREHEDRRLEDRESHEYSRGGSVKVSTRYTMSINAAEALDPWHGYGADCPDKTPR